MSALPNVLRVRWRRERLRAAMQTAAWALPVAATIAGLLWQRVPPAWTLPLLVVPIIAALAWSALRAARCDARWLARRLDAAHPALDDSAALLFAPAATLSGVQRVQRARVLARVSNLPATPLGARWPWRMIVLAWLVGAASWWLAGHSERNMPPAASAAAVAASATHTRVTGFALRIEPPAATGRAASTQAGWSARVPTGALLHWRLALDPAPRAAWLRFHDGSTLPLVRAADGTWRASLRLREGRLYRLLLDARAPALAGTSSGRLDAVPDQAPRVRVLAPVANPLQYSGQGSVTLLFRAEDDYALQPAATLLLVRAAGSGENVVFTRSQVALGGRGTARALDFTRALDPRALGMQPGDELVARLEVRDRGGQQATSPSVILRWPLPEVGGGSGVDGLARATLPAYFRSQRQIILDAEALLRERASLSAEVFARRANGLGDDQRALRLRYGQFLGMEADGAPQLPVADGDAGDDHAANGHDASHEDTTLPLADAAPARAAASPATTATDAHDHAAATPAPSASVFGDGSGITAEFGHTHDMAEAATLLDPGTKTLLRGALDAMWDSELHLRQADPRAALPFAYRALRLIKQVQQADRIYLARIGNELPPYDPARRMQGKRDDIAPLVLAWSPMPVSDAPLNAAWRALLSPGAHADLPALQAWLAAHPGRGSDPLSVIAAIETLRAAPDCLRCRDVLVAALWPLLAAPMTTPERRPAADAEGQRYLDALQRQREGRAP